MDLGGFGWMLVDFVVGGFRWMLVDFGGFCRILVDFGGFWCNWDAIGNHQKSSEFNRNHRISCEITEQLFLESPDFQNMPNIRNTPRDFLSISDFR